MPGLAILQARLAATQCQYALTQKNIKIKTSIKFKRLDLRVGIKDLFSIALCTAYAIRRIYVALEVGAAGWLGVAGLRQAASPATIEMRLKVCLQSYKEKNI